MKSIDDIFNSLLPGIWPKSAPPSSPPSLDEWSKLLKEFDRQEQVSIDCQVIRELAVCNKFHPLVQFEGKECPCCKYQSEMVKAREALKAKVAELEDLKHDFRTQAQIAARLLREEELKGDN